MKLTRYLTCLCVLAASPLSATAFTTTFDTFNAPTLTIQGTLLDGGPLTSGTLSYDALNGTGSLSLDANLATLGSAEILAASITTNANGSLHVAGTLSALAAANTFSGDLAVGYDYDAFNDVTTFMYTTLPGPGPGFFINSGPLGGNFIAFTATSSLLAFVANPFPTYVPVPPALLLFSSALFGLVGLNHKRNMKKRSL